MTYTPPRPRKAVATISGPHPGFGSWLFGRYDIKLMLGSTTLYIVQARTLEAARRKARRQVNAANEREMRRQPVEVIE